MAYMLIAALVIAGWVVVYIGARRMSRRMSAELRLEFQPQIDALSAKVTALERTVGIAAALPSAVRLPGKMKSLAAGAVAPSAQPQASVTQSSADVTSETLATIAETITALLGRKVRILSVKILENPHAVANPWAQQGRVIVQASHNVAQRGRE
ncbi:MAG TPA: hypothetical protein VNZ03_24955 [Terriglobales bacterium]|nr:hypothetical protein [Terriglobales bacterium]